MSNEEKAVQNAPITETKEEQQDEKKYAERGLFFCFVAQCDISSQMDVVRWLEKDSRYRVVYIVHDRDIHDKDGVYKKDSGDIPYKAGDRKKDHIHGIVKVGSKITAKTLTKRFGGYLHFQLCHDSAEYAAYLTHSTFDSQDKAKYQLSELRGDRSLYDQIADEAQSQLDLSATVSQVCMYLRTSDRPVEDMVKAGDNVALRALMSHSYFYATFCSDKNKKSCREE